MGFLSRSEVLHRFLSDLSRWNEAKKVQEPYKKGRISVQRAVFYPNYPS
jgi:hypothetical protein